MQTYCKVNRCRFADTHTTSGHKCGTCGIFGHGQIECCKTELMNNLFQYHGDKLPVTEHCKVPDCTFSQLHKTRAHECRTCNKYGHGVLNCPDNQIYFNITCPLCMVDNKISSNQKKIYGLQDKCAVCKDNEVNVFLPDCGHGCLCMSCVQIMCEDELDIVQEDNLDQHIIEQAKNKLKDKTERVYTILYGGMGCSWYIRRDDQDASLEGFFMHSDNWGQYGTDDRPKLNLFLNDYKKID
jgi:hypothetical protein